MFLSFFFITSWKSDNASDFHAVYTRDNNKGLLSCGPIRPMLINDVIWAYHLVYNTSLINGMDFNLTILQSKIIKPVDNSPILKLLNY